MQETLVRELLGLKTLIATASLHIKPAEMGVFGLFFLCFVLVFFFSMIFWRYRLIFTLCLLIEASILACSPFGVAFVMRHLLYPIKVQYAQFSPFVYTSGFHYDVEITNRGKLAITECMLTITPLRAKNESSKLVKLHDMFLPLAAYTQVLQKPIAPGQKARFSGIIDTYRYGQEYKSALDCH